MKRFMFLCVALVACSNGVVDPPNDQADSNLTGELAGFGPWAEPTFFTSCRKSHATGKGPEINCAVIGSTISGTMPCQYADLDVACTSVPPHSLDGAEGTKHIGETICMPPGDSSSDPLILLCPKR